MLNRLYFIFVLSLLPYRLWANDEMLFIKNEGQWTPEVQYKADLTIGSFILEKDKLSFLLNNLGHTHYQRVKQHDHDLKAHFYKIGFIGASPSNILPTDISPTYFNYFLGNNPNKWRSNVKAYKGATFKDLYKGIDLRIKGNGEGIEYDFVIQPGADPNTIVQQYEGIENISLRKNEINYKTSVGEVVEKNIVAYQIVNGQKVSVRCVLRLIDKTQISYTFPDDFNRNEVLVIDPTIVFSTHVGSTADSWGYTATYDNAGNMYLGGYVNATDAATNFYPTSVGAFQATFAGGTGGNTAPGSGNGNGLGFSSDMGITKLNSNGTARIYSTYIGGLDNEAPNSLIVDDIGNLGIYGTTYSSNFPITAGAFDGTYNGDADVVVINLNPTGTALVGSTFMGGTGMDGMNFNPREEIPGNLKRNYGDQNRGEINVDATGNLFVTSSTLSTNFPTTMGAYQTTLGGAQDACVFKLNRNCSQLVYSTYLGGTKDDAGYSLNLAAGGNLYVAGGTMSTDFPTTAGVLNSAYKGGLYDGFIVLLNASGTGLLNSTFIGTTGNDQVYFVKLDDVGDVYVTGQSTGSYPVVNAAYSNANSGQFIAKLDPALSTTIYSTVFGSGGGKTCISPTAFLVDTCQNVYVSGWGNAANSFFTTQWGFEENRLQNVPITNDAFQKTTDGNDFYFFVLAKNATNILYGSYFGTSGVDEHVDGGTSRFDKRGVMYQAMCASCGGGLTTPTTLGVVSPNRPGANCNILGLKIEFNLGATSVTVNASPRATGCVPLTVQFTSVLYNVQNVLWDFRDGTFSTLTNPVHTFTDTGRYLVKLIGTDPNSCNVSDTAYVEVWVRDDSLEANFLPNIQINCNQNKLDIASTGGNATTQYLWTLGDGNFATSQTVSHVYAASGSYNVKLVMTDTTRCNLRDSFTTQIFIPPTIDLAIVPNDTFGCPPLTVDFNNATPYNFGDYKWYFGDGDSSTLRSPAHTYQSTGQYQAIVFWSDTTTCNKADTARFLISVIDSSADASFVVNRRFFNCDSVQITVFSNYVGEDSELWIWGDGATSTTNPASHTYMGTTFDTLRHVIVDLKQICHPIDTQFVIISLEPLQTDINISDTLGCVPFTTSFTGVSPLVTTRYFWFFGDGDSASGSPVTHTFVDTGTYRILQVSIDSNACVNIDSNYATVIVIDDFVDAQFSVNTINDCDSDLYVQMVDQSINAVTYFWDFGDGTTSVLQNPDHHYYLPGSYTITLIVTDTTRCHPTDTLRRIVTLKPNAVADFNLADVCDGTAVNFTNTSTQTNATYSWSFGDNTFDSLTNPRHIYGTSGTYVVNLAITDTGSCNVFDTIEKPVIVYAQPIANFILERDTYKFETDVFLQNTSINANTYNWSFGDGNTSTDFSPTYQYSKSIGWHQICLEAYILNAPCRDTICDSVYISFIPLIGVPNAFSPNDDGINDRVFVEGKGIIELEFRIFNRWGQQVYYGTDQKEGWDGVYKGERQELEVYTYLVRARFINDVRKELKGNITLLR